uniref:GMC_OxRdtase_N domain-containing protein n=1 Tax=Elaeophora elaphi TaxID=1147741 RepID=A0A158Q716_9BILA
MLQESWEARLPSKYTKYGNDNTSNYNAKGFLRIDLTPDGLSEIAVEQKLAHVVAIGDTMNTNGSSTSGDISRATQTVNKPSGVVVSLNSPKIYIEENQREQVSGGSFKNVYTQGNSVQEVIRALNDSDDDEVIVDIMSKVSKKHESVSVAEANIANDRIQKSAEASGAANAQGKHDDNPFTYSAGQLRLHGNRVGTYDMQKSRTLGIKRDVLAADGECHLSTTDTSNYL